MSKKYISVLFILVAITTLLTIPISSNDSKILNQAAEVVSATEDSYPADTFIFDMPTLSQTEKNSIARRFHEGYPKLVSVMLELRRQNVISSNDLKNIHKHLSNYAVDSSAELPHNDKDLIDYLYDNNLINESQYENILDLLDD